MIQYKTTLIVEGQGHKVESKILRKNMKCMAQPSSDSRYIHVW